MYSCDADYTKHSRIMRRENVAFIKPDMRHINLDLNLADYII